MQSTTWDICTATVHILEEAPEDSAPLLSNPEGIPFTGAAPLFAKCARSHPQSTYLTLRTMRMCGDRGCLAPAAAPLAQRQLFRRPQHALRVVAKSKGGSSGSGRASPQGSNGQGGSKKPAGIRLTDRLQEKSIDIIQDFAPDGHDCELGRSWKATLGQPRLCGVHKRKRLPAALLQGPTLLTFSTCPTCA